MLDSLLVTFGSAAIGGALVYLLWSVVSRRLAGFRAVPRKRVKHAAPPPPDESRVGAGDDKELADIRHSLAELARAQVSIIERLEDTSDTRPRDHHGPEAVTERLEEVTTTLRALAERPGPEAALADGMGALDGRLATIEDRIETLGPPEDAADRDAAMAEAVEALANRLEGVESGLVRVLRQAEAATPADPDPETQAAALRAVLDEAFPIDALPALETRLTERLASLSDRVETAGSARVSDVTAGLIERLEAIEAQLRAAADSVTTGRQASDALAEQVSSLQRQLEAPAEVGFSEETLAELQARLRAVLDDGSDREQHVALAEALQTLDVRLDAVQTRLDALASDRSAGRTLELIGAISTLQTDTARLKSGIERGIAQISESAGASAERISALDSRIAALETAITGADGSVGAEAVDALVRRLEGAATPDLPASLAEALKAEIPSLLDSVATMLAERLDQQPAPRDTAARTQAETPAAAREASEPNPDPGGPTANAATPGPPASLSPVPISAAHGAEPAGPLALAGRPRDPAETAQAEAALLRARPGLATLIGRHAQQKHSAGDS